MTNARARREAGPGSYEERWYTHPEALKLVPLDSEPLVSESPPAILQSWLTPNPLFYVRNHFPMPTVELATWALAIEGHVERPVRLQYADLRHRFPRQTMSVTLECAGNNRSDLRPSAPGNQFQSGAVSTAVWSGVPLKAVLELAGLKQGAQEVLFEGADVGKPEPARKSEPYLRSLPLEVATHPDTLLAYEMNGEALSREHGFPLRLVVPGWYGMASVKWLVRVTVLDRKFVGFFQTERYIMEREGHPTVPVSRISVKSLVTWPQADAVLPLQAHCIAGLAWSGHAPVRRVEVSTDGGKSWKQAELVGPGERYAWRQWSFIWKPPAPGKYTLMARATDEAGNVQPMEPVWNKFGYAVNFVKPVPVTIAGQAAP